MIEFDDISVWLDEKQILTDLSGRLEQGELAVVVGANASGKSTLMRCILGMVPQSYGRMTRCSTDGSTPRCAYAIDNSRLPAMLTGLQVLQLASEALSGASMTTSLEFVDCVSATAHMDREVSTYSMGTRQKLCIAMALVGNPSILILDEALNGLDLLSEDRACAFLLHYARKTGACVVLVTHNVDLAQRHADKVWLLHDGRLVRTWDTVALDKMRASRESLSMEALAIMEAL